MWCVLLLLLGGFYVGRIIKECFYYGTIKHSIKLLSNFCSAYPSNRYEKELNLLLQQSSVIREYVQHPRLSRTLLPNANYYNASKIRLIMMDKMDDQRHNIVESLNPTHAIKKLILLPVTVLLWLGFKPGKITSTIIASAWWILQYLLEIFQPEIRELLVELISKLIAN